MCYCASQHLQAKSAVKQPHRSQQTQGAWSLINKMCQWGVIALCDITKSSCGAKIQKCDTDVCLIFILKCNIYKCKNAIKRRYYDVFLQPQSWCQNTLFCDQQKKKNRLFIEMNSGAPFTDYTQSEVSGLCFHSGESHERSLPPTKSNPRLIS